MDAQQAAEQLVEAGAELEKLSHEKQRLDAAIMRQDAKSAAARAVLAKLVGHNVPVKAWLAGGKVVTARFTSFDNAAVTVIEPEKAAS